MRLLAAMAFAPLLSAQLLYVGTYTKPQSDSEGILAFRFDPKAGKFESLGLATAGPNPSYLAVDPTGKYLYAIHEIDSFQGKRAGAVSAYSIDKATGKLTLLNQVSSVGPGPCHVAVDGTGKVVLVANYGGGSFASYPVQSDGKLGEAASFVQAKGSSVDRQRQSAPHGHQMIVTKNNKFALGADLGTDRVLVFKLDTATGKMEANTPDAGTVKPGSGPRHMVLAPDQKHLYVLNEMISTVSTLEFDANAGTMKEIEQVSMLAAPVAGNSGAEIEISKDGRVVYASNRGHNSIAVMAVDKKTGKLKLIQNEPTGGGVPRGFTIDPSGSWLVAGNQQAHDFTLHKVDRKSGKLSPVGQAVKAGAPVSFVFVK